MTVFVDTSALFAVLDAEDQYHSQARDLWTALIQKEETLVCTNYVLVETFALVQRRLGIEAARVLQEDITPMLHIEWITDVPHLAGIAAVLVAGNRHLSLVDCISFEVMRRMGIKTAFAYDHHFVEQGFDCIPIDG
jgi:predicted nucleic acid-binding protein